MIQGVIVIEYLIIFQGCCIVYNLIVGVGFVVVFCGGLKFDMEGIKVLYFEDWVKVNGCVFLWFDYLGYGISDGVFEDGCIGDWFEDVSVVIDLVDGFVIFVGLSMGGWVLFLLLCECFEKVVGLVMIVGVFDFIEDGYWVGFMDVEKVIVMNEGCIEILNEYVEFYVIICCLIEDGWICFILCSLLQFNMFVCIFQGLVDDVVL